MNSAMRPSASIPTDTYRAARQIYSAHNVYLRIGDQLEEISAKTDLRRLDPNLNSSLDALTRLSLVTAFQYAEFIPDSVAADASRKRLDWKYALHLPVHHLGVLPQALSAFRERVCASPSALKEFDRLLGHLRQTGLFAETALDDPAVGTVLPTVCRITSLHRLYRGMKDALVALAAQAPNWLLENMPPYWYTRYKRGDLSQPPADRAVMETEAIRIGSDIQFLIAQLRAQPFTCLAHLPDIQVVTRLWEEQFTFQGGQVQWQQPDCANCALNRLKKFTI